MAKQTQPRLTETVTIQRYEPGGSSSDSAGDWLTIDTVRAKITPKQGSETVSGQQVESIHRHDILMRYRSKLTSEHRLLGPIGEVYNIVSVAILKQRGWWSMLSCVREG